MAHLPPVLVAFALGAVGCGADIMVLEQTSGGASTGAATSSSAGSASAAAGSGTGGDSTSSSASGGGAGGSSSASGGGGGGGALACAPASTAPCYEGPNGTLGVGICAAGTKTCSVDGSAWGPCVGQVLPMLEDCATLADDNCDGSISCADAYWSRSFGGPGMQQPRAVAADLAGNVFLTGWFHGDVDFGGGPLSNGGDMDTFLVKLDPGGNHVWSKGFGDASYQEGSSIAAVQDGSIVLAAFVSGIVDLGGGPLPETSVGDAVLARFDGAGNHVWSKRFGGVEVQEIMGVAVDAAGDIVTTGFFRETVDFGGGPFSSPGDADVFVAKFDGAGNHLWSKRFGGPGAQIANAIALDPMGGIVIAGFFFATLDFGGGVKLDTGPGSGFVASLGPDGVPSWAKNGKGGIPAAAAVDAAGRIVLAGNGVADFGDGPIQGGPNEAFVVALDPNGDHLWTKRFNSANYQTAWGVAVDGAGDVLVTGHFEGTLTCGGAPLVAKSGADVFLAKFDTAGSHIWSKRYGETGFHQGHYLSVDAAGNPLIAGYFQGTLDFGFGAHMNPGGPDDIFVAKLPP